MGRWGRCGEARLLHFAAAQTQMLKTPIAAWEAYAENTSEKRI